MGFDLNQFITKIFMDYSSNWTIDIIQFENEMNQVSSNDTFYHCEQSKKG